MRAMSNDELDRWLSNWARWLRDSGDCYPQGARLASAEKGYRSPQRWHHGTKAPDGPPIYPIQAQLVETAVRDAGFPQTWRSAIVARWVILPDHVLLARRSPTDRWDRKRAAEAAQSERTYLEATQHARARLASILAGSRGSLP